MKKAILLFSFCMGAFLLISNVSLGQTADSNSVAVKSNEIVSLLTSKLGLTQSQTPVVQSLVNEFAGKFAKTNNAIAASGSGLKAKVEKEEQSNLQKDFSSGLSKLLNPSQVTKYASVKDKVNTLFAQVK